MIFTSIICRSDKSTLLTMLAHCLFAVLLASQVVGCTQHFVGHSVSDKPIHLKQGTSFALFSSKDVNGDDAFTLKKYFKILPVKYRRKMRIYRNTISEIDKNLIKFVLKNEGFIVTSKYEANYGLMYRYNSVCDSWPSEQLNKCRIVGNFESCDYKTIYPTYCYQTLGLVVFDISSFRKLGTIVNLSEVNISAYEYGREDNLYQLRRRNAKKYPYPDALIISAIRNLKIGNQGEFKSEIRWKDPGYMELREFRQNNYNP